jgi:hypothetical protein
MPYPTTGPNTELQAVNQILASVGQAPVNTLTTETTYVQEQTGSFIGSITGTVLSTDEVLDMGTFISGTGVTMNTSVVTASSPSATSFDYDYTLNLSSSATGNITLNKAVVSYRVETQTNPDVAIAYNTLTEVTREVQSEGWVYNTERNYTGFQPDAATKKIVVPNNVIQADLSQDHVSNLGRNVVKRGGGVLYDTITHTDVWNTEETIYLDILWEFEYENIPQPIQSYIVARAAAIVSSRVVGDPNQFQMLQQKEAYARAMALEYDCNQGDHSFFGAPENGNYYKAYSPFNTLIR